MMSRLSSLFPGICALFLLSGCPGNTNPEPDELHGMWSNLDLDWWRVFEFSETRDEPELAGMSDTYAVWFYLDELDPVPVQRGTYTVQDGVLLTTPAWTSDGSNVGTTFSNEILGFTPDMLTLASTTGYYGKRFFQPTDELP